MSSVSISCLPPKPPPTRPATTRTRSGGRSYSAHRARRVRKGTWVEERTTIRSSPVSSCSSKYTRQPCVSRLACCTRWVRKVSSYTTAASAKPCSTLPISPCTSPQTLFAGRAIRDSGPLGCRTGAPGSMASSGSRTYGSTSYSTATRRQPSSAATSLSATTAATRWPAKRTTSSSSRVSSGSSVGCSCRAEE